MEKMILVVPVYNEEEVLPDFFTRLVAVAEKISLFGLILVDDGSTDRTSEIICAHAENMPFFTKLVRLSRNFGQQNAIIGGLQYAYEWAQQNNLHWIGLIDVDLQDRPEDFEELLNNTKNQDIVFGYRVSRNDPLIVRAFSNLFHKFFSKVTHFPIAESSGTFSIMRREIAHKICQYHDPNPYFPGLRAWMGFRQKGIPLKRDTRHKGNSKVGFLGLFSLAFRATVLYSNILLKTILFLGLIIVLFSTLISVGLVIAKLLDLVEVPGTTSIIVTILFSLGIQMTCLGLLAVIMNRALINSSNQPSYAVMETKEFSRV